MQFEFDPVHKILLVRVEGRLTDELLAECYKAIRERSVATDASAGIFDFSFVTEWALSTALIQTLAREEPAMPDAAVRRRILVAPATVGFGLARMFQMMGESTRPLLSVVRTLSEALTALGAQSPHFEPLE